MRADRGVPYAISMTEVLFETLAAFRAALSGVLAGHLVNGEGRR